MRVLVAVLALFLFCRVANAQASVDKIDAFGELAFGKERLAPYLGALERIASRIGNEQRIAQAVRTAAMFLDLARIAQTEAEFRVLDALRLEFNRAVDVIAETGEILANELGASSIGRELNYAYGQVRKILDDSEAAAQFLLWEAEVLQAYGISSATSRLVVIFRLWQTFPPEELQRLGNELRKAMDTLKVTDPRGMSRWVDGGTDIVIGIGTAAGDVLAFRKSPWGSGITMLSGAKQAFEGLKKIFGQG